MQERCLQRSSYAVKVVLCHCCKVSHFLATSKRGGIFCKNVEATTRGVNISGLNIADTPDHRGVRQNRYFSNNRKTCPRNDRITIRNNLCSITPNQQRSR